MLAKNDYRSAIALYQNAVSLKPSSNNLYFLANAYWFSGNNDLARSYLDKSLRLSPEYYKSRSLMGLIALSEGDVAEAIKHLDKAITQNPKDIDNYKNLGLSYLLDKSYETAIKVFDKASELNVNDKTVLLNKADALNLSGKIELSYDIYRKIKININTK